MTTVLGGIQAAREALPWAQAMTVRLYRWTNLNSQSPWTRRLPRWSDVQHELRYWASVKSWQASRSFETVSPEARFLATSDASTTGYGIHITRESDGQVMTAAADRFAAGGGCARAHSTAKELQAVLFGLQGLALRAPHERHITWLSDCRAVVAVANRFRTQSSPLLVIGAAIARLVARMRWTLRAQWIPREENAEMDLLPRTVIGRYYQGG